MTSFRSITILESAPGETEKFEAFVRDSCTGDSAADITARVLLLAGPVFRDALLAEAEALMSRGMSEAQAASSIMVAAECVLGSLAGTAALNLFAEGKQSKVLRRLAPRLERLLIAAADRNERMAAPGGSA